MCNLTQFHSPTRKKKTKNNKTTTTIYKTPSKINKDSILVTVHIGSRHVTNRDSIPAPTSKHRKHRTYNREQNTTASCETDSNLENNISRIDRYSVTLCIYSS